MGVNQPRGDRGRGQRTKCFSSISDLRWGLQEDQPLLLGSMTLRIKRFPLLPIHVSAAHDSGCVGMEATAAREVREAGQRPISSMEEDL